MNPTLRNSVIIALAQTGLLVAGILAVAASNRLAREMGYPDLRDFLFFMNYGWLMLPLPVIWIAVAGRLLLKARDRAPREAAVYFSGITILVVLATALVTEAVEPWRAVRNEISPTVELAI